MTNPRLDLIVSAPFPLLPGGGGGRGYVRNFWLGMCTGTPEPLVYTRPSPAEFGSPILDTKLNSQNRFLSESRYNFPETTEVNTFFAIKLKRK